MNLDQSSDGRLIQFHSACSNYSFTWTSFQFIFLKFMFYNSVFLFFFYLVGNASHESLFPVCTSPFGSTAFFLLCSLKISATDQRLFLERQLYLKLLHATATGMRQSRVTNQGQNLTQCCIFFFIFQLRSLVNSFWFLLERKVMYALNRLMPKTFIPLHTMVRLKILEKFLKAGKPLQYAQNQHW